VQQHVRFYSAIAAAVVAYPLVMLVDPSIALVAAGDIFFLVFLGAMLAMAFATDIDGLRRRAKVEDEGIVVIVVLTIGAIAFSFASIFSILNGGADRPLRHLLTALVSIPLGWAVLNTLFAFHYSRLYYAPEGDEGGKSEDAGGLDFPDTPEPCIWDFFYFAFVIGATFQTSDVGIRTTDFRVVAMFHSIASFIFNTVLLALAVNLGAILLG